MFTILGDRARFASDEPYWYMMSGALPPAMAVSSFCRA